MTSSATTSSQSVSSVAVWAGRILQLLLLSFLLFDSGIKVLKLDFAVKATVQAGFPASVVAPIGWSLLLGLVLYTIPRTAILGAILVSCYLGGAVAANVLRSSPLGFDLFPGIIGVLVWGALWLRDGRLRALIPLRQDQ